MDKNKVDKRFYMGNDVVWIAKRMLGMVLYTQFEGEITAGRIVETEAYCGATDKACHAYPDKRTPRTETMYEEGGVAYVYLCYGIHHLLNVVVNERDKADAVLIRAIEPLVGVDKMLERKQVKKAKPRFSSGPGNVAKVMGVMKTHDGVELTGNNIWIEYGEQPVAQEIVETTRVGIDYAEEDALLPWRFYIKGNKWISKV